MADFKTHITASSLMGVGYGATACLGFGVPLPTCLLAGGLCSVSGMLPDMDSQSGVPVREGSAFAAAVVPMLMVDRFQQLGWTPEMMVLAGGGIYLAVRWGLPYFLGKFSKHRGMWHSLPAALIAGLLAFLLCSCHDVNIRVFKAGAVVMGYLSHLLLDEIYSLEWYRGRLRFKKSFGTAMKFFSPTLWPNVSTYAKLIVLAALAVGDPFLMRHFHSQPAEPVHRTATELFDVFDSVRR